MKNIILCLLLIPLLSTCTSSEPFEPVQDGTGLLSKDEIALLKNYNSGLLKDHDIDFRLILEDGSQNAEDFALRANALMTEIAKESPGVQGRIILLYIDTTSDLARLEISGDLEGIYTDAFSGYIQQRHMVYFFRQKRISDGVLAASEMIYERAREAKLGKTFIVPRKAMAGGGGATAAAAIGGTIELSAPSPTLLSEGIRPGATPIETIMAYRAAMAAGNREPDLDIFTGPTQVMLKNWTVTPAQMQNGVKTIDRCSRFPGRTFHDAGDRLAVIRYPVKERQCHPWFLEKSDGIYRLDLATMQKVIVMNQKNQYHFRKRDHPYAFGFNDLRFDKHGYPHE